MAKMTAKQIAQIRAEVEKATDCAVLLQPTIINLWGKGCKSLAAIAAGLNAEGFAAPPGGTWTAQQVSAMLARIPEFRTRLLAGFQLGWMPLNDLDCDAWERQDPDYLAKAKRGKRLKANAQPQARTASSARVLNP